MRLGNAAVGLTQQEYAISAEGVAHDHMQNTPEFLGFYPWYDTENKYEGVLNHMGAFASNILKYVSCAVSVGMMAVCAVLPFEAHADTYSDLVAAQNSHASSVQREQALREQLKGVQSDLLEQVVELDKLTNTQIPVAQEKADAANDTAAADADDLNVSMNRGERLKAIEQRIAKLKSDADTKAAAALSAASEAQDVRDSLDALRVQGENRRAELESKQDQLQSDAAKQAVQTVLLQSKIDDANRQYAQQQADAAGSANPGQSARIQFSRPGRPSQACRPLLVRARITEITGTCIRPANAHGMRTTVVRKWASARRLTCITEGNGI